MTENVWICGIGAATPLGANAAFSAAAMRCRLSRAREHPTIHNLYGDRAVVHRALYLSDRWDTVARMGALARLALDEILPLLKEPARVVTFMGLPERRREVVKRVRSRVVAKIREATPFTDIHTHEGGHASGLVALGQAMRALSDGKHELCIAGGVDSWIDLPTVHWLDVAKRLKTAVNPSGFIPGEGAGFLLLATDKAVREHGLPKIGRVRAVAVAKELAEADAPMLGEGMSAAYRQALGQIGEEKIDDTLLDLNGDRERTDAFAFTMARVGNRFVNPTRFFAPASGWGDVGAASGPLAILLALDAARVGTAPGPLTLVAASSLSSNRAVAIVQHA